MFKKGEILIAAFTLVYIIGFLIYYLSIGNTEFIWYLIVLVAIALLIGLTIRKTNLDYLALFGLSLWGLLHLAGGGVKIGSTVLYGLRIYPFINLSDQFYVLKMDQVIHLYGFLVTAIVMFQLIKTHLKEKRPTFVPYLLAAAASMGFGALNEILEFLAVIVLPQTGVGDYFNTGLDLIFNFFGAIIGVIICYLRIKLKN